MADAQDDLHFLYVADPMCSWCYGFEPVVARLARHFEGRLPVQVVMGGLRPGTTRAMREKDRSYLRDAWAQVSEASGQSFDLSFFERETFVYDTEPPCRAVVTMRRSNSMQALSFLGTVSRAFYADNRDITDNDVLADIAAEAGLDRASFLADLTSPDARNATARDFMIAKDAGIEGFPLLAAGSQATGYALITQGFRPIDGLPEAIEDWLEKGAPVSQREA